MADDSQNGEGDSVYYKTQSIDTLVEDNAVWDDSALIEAYERAISLTYEAVEKADTSAANATHSKKQSTITGDAGATKSQTASSKVKTKKQPHWKVGAFCMAPYAEDGELYEARIVSIQPSAGTCVVLYLGYDERVSISLDQLQMRGVGVGASVRSATPHSATCTRRRRRQRSVLLHRHNNQHHTTTTDTNSASGSADSSASTAAIPPTKRFRIEEDASGVAVGGPDGDESRRPAEGGHGANYANAAAVAATSIKALPMLPPPPPPPGLLRGDSTEDEALSSMLMSWYMSGYHTGYYQAMQDVKKEKR